VNAITPMIHMRCVACASSIFRWTSPFMARACWRIQ